MMSANENKDSTPKLHVCSHELGELLAQHVRESTGCEFELAGIEWRPVDGDGDPILLAIAGIEKAQVEFLLHLEKKVRD